MKRLIAPKIINQMRFSVLLIKPEFNYIPKKIAKETIQSLAAETGRTWLPLCYNNELN
jgi:hypothetical protein